MADRRYNETGVCMCANLMPGTCSPFGRQPAPMCMPGKVVVCAYQSCCWSIHHIAFHSGDGDILLAFAFSVFSLSCYQTGAIFSAVLILRLDGQSSPHYIGFHLHLELVDVIIKGVVILVRVYLTLSDFTRFQFHDTLYARGHG